LVALLRVRRTTRNSFRVDDNETSVNFVTFRELIHWSNTNVSVNNQRVFSGDSNIFLVFTSNDDRSERREENVGGKVTGTIVSLQLHSTLAVLVANLVDLSSSGKAVDANV